MIYKDKIFKDGDLKGQDFSRADINGANFVDTKIENTVLDLESFIVFGNSKGFILEQQKPS